MKTGTPVHWLATVVLIAIVCGAACGQGKKAAATAPAAASPAAAAPATAAEAAKVLDLRTFPLVPGAVSPNDRTLANLDYEAPQGCQQAFAFQKQQLVERGWKELPGSYLSDQSCSGTFQKQGFLVSVTTTPGDTAAKSQVYVSQHGNVALDRLPQPPGAKPFYSTPLSAAVVSDVPLAETKDACRRLLLAAGWTPYGAAGDSQFFKRNAVRLQANVQSAPAQGGKTVVTYSAELMSVELPAPPNAEQVQYADSVTQLSCDAAGSEEEVAAFYRQALVPAGWQATTENLLKIDFRRELLFRNPAKDLLTLELTTVEGKTRILLRHQTAAEVAAIEARLKAELAKKNAAANAPASRVAIKLPAGARQVQASPTEIEFQTASGQAKAAIEQLRAQFRDAGWQESLVALEGPAGTLTLTKGEARIGITYVDPGFIPGEITVSGAGLEVAK